MSEQMARASRSVEDTAQVVAQGVAGAAGRTVAVARQTGSSLSEFRHLVRAQPVTMALLMLGFGYVLGRLVGAEPCPLHDADNT